MKVIEMTDQQQQQANGTPKEKIEVHIPSELDYTYRDIFNVFVGPGDVVMEFGNLHRSTPGHATISNRIVLSVANAYNLQQTLQKVLTEAQAKLQHSLKQGDE
jgi:uncharacterized protein DUF3467